MSFSEEHGMVKKIKNYFSNLFRPSQATASSGQPILINQEIPETEDEDLLYQQEATVRSKPEHNSIHDQSYRPVKNSDNGDNDTIHNSQELHPVEKKQNASESNLIAGGLYAVQEEKDAPYWLAKVIYIEEKIVHLICYAERISDLSQKIGEQDLTIGLNQEDSSFGLAHLPLAKDYFTTHAILLGQGSLTDKDFSTYQVFVDSIFDCLDEQAPDWLKKAASYAAWRYDRNAMAALTDRYLIGVDLLRDSKKSLYWLNRLVHASQGIVQPGKSITKEQEILTGGIYATLYKEEQYQICKIVLKDKHGVQQLNFSALLDHLPKGTHPFKIVKQVTRIRTGQPHSLSHATLSASDFLEQSPIFLGVLPITLNEIHCYRTHLRKMFDGAAFRESAWDNLLRRAKQGDAQAQLDAAYRYLDGDPLWEVQRNIPEAIQWLTEAANQGNSLAAYTLALLFQQGEEGIRPDPKLGFEWLTYSAQLNYGMAQLRTADCYQQGKGCATNAALAHAWYSLAIIADNDLSEEAKKKAKQRKYEIEGSCSAEQLADAKKYFLQLQETRSEEMFSHKDA
jgi:TPR repeat protein